jgi:hypothetical protein
MGGKWRSCVRGDWQSNIHDELFSPVVYDLVVRTIVAAPVHPTNVKADLRLFVADAKGTFLYGELEADKKVAIRATEHFVACFQQAWRGVYVTGKPGHIERFEKCYDVLRHVQVHDPKYWDNHVLYLNRALYGLRTAPRRWLATFFKALENELQLVRVQAEVCAYRMTRELAVLRCYW